MTDQEFIQELQRRSILTPAAAASVTRDAGLTGQPAEQLIAERRLAPAEKIAEVKSQIFNVPYQKINFANFDLSLLTVIPEETARTYGVAPLSREGDTFVVGMLHPDDMKAQEALKFIANRNRVNLGVYVISWTDWREMLNRYSPFKKEIDSAVQSLGVAAAKDAGGARKVVRLEEEALRGDTEAPIIRIVSETLKEAVASRASDVHIEPQEKYLRIRFRVDGDLKETASLPVSLAQAIVSRVKVISGLKIDETRMPQDGRFRARISDREIDFRVATFPTPLGEKAAIRVLDSETGLKNFTDLGLIGENLEKVQAGLTKPYGMILLTGPTGSGKTTTLYALLQGLNQENVNIVSLEDPVEYFVSGVNQSQVRPEIGYDFASGLRQILRQDPDVIMVGEVRDNETAGLAVQAALTGHIVLSTLHTNNSISVIPRLLDMGVQPFLLPASLNLMIAQRLVRLLCNSCKVKEPAAPAIEKAIKKTFEAVPPEIAQKYPEPYAVYRAEGCSVCKGKGTMGRIGIFEVFSMSPGVEEAISSGPTLQKLQKEAKAQGMVSLRADGVMKALDGLVSIEEVIGGTEE